MYNPISSEFFDQLTVAMERNIASIDDNKQIMILFR
mgnify:CR=1 FL=1